MSDFHPEFVKALQGEEQRMEAFLKDPTHVARMRVYLNNSVSACADAILKNFPTIEKLVGTEFLRAAALVFVKQTPPMNPVLATYGEDFPGFLQEFPPAASLPYLRDVALLDLAWTKSMYAENAASLSPQHLVGLSEDAVAAMTPGLHPSVVVLESDWPAWKIWKANREDEAPQQMSIEQGWSGALVWWSGKGASSQNLDRAQTVFLHAIASGMCLSKAIEQGAIHSDPAALFKFFSEALTMGVFAVPSQFKARASS